MNKHPLWFIQWEDAAHPLGEWRDVEGATEEVHPIWSAGFLIVGGEKTVTIAGSLALSEDGASYFGAEITIPVGCIRKIVQMPLDGGMPKVLYPVPKKGTRRPKKGTK